MAELYVLVYPPDFGPKLEEILGHRDKCKRCLPGRPCSDFRRLQQEGRVILKRAREAGREAGARDAL